MSEDPRLEIRSEPVGEQHERGLLTLFESTAVACHCRYWHFTGDKNEWLDRLANAPEQNRDALTSELRAGRSEGLVALVGSVLVGWLKLTPAERVSKLYEQRLYRGLPCFAGDRSGVWAVGCVLVDERFRRRGVARALIQASVELARARGARALEAFPRGEPDAPDAELWMGPLPAFLEAGFTVVNDFRPYPVLRLDISK